MGGSGGSSKSTTKVRFAEYIETTHSDLIARTQAVANEKAAASPYADFDEFSTDIINFVSAYSFALYMGNINVDTYWDSAMSNSTEASVIGDMVEAESSLLDDELEQTTMPRFKTGLRDINSVVSTAFIIGKSAIESAKTKSVAKFDAETRYKMIPIGHDRWNKKLQWQQSLHQEYIKMLDFQTRVQMDARRINQENEVNDALWHFTTLDFERAILASLQGATTTSTSTAANKSSAVGGAFSGAASGAMIGSTFGPQGAIIGGAAGGLIGLAQSFF